MESRSCYLLSDKEDLYKTVFFILSIISGIVLIPFAYSIIWYEKFGSDKKRTLINKLVASLCWNEIAFFSTVQILYVVRFYFGPLPPFLCFWMFVIRKTIIINGIFTLNAMALVRYIFIFWLKNPAGMDGYNKTFPF